MELEIRHFTPEQQEAFKAEHPLAKPKKYALFEGSLCWGFYDTEEEVKAAFREMYVFDRVMEDFRIWRDGIAEAYSLTWSEVNKIVKENLT